MFTYNRSIGIPTGVIMLTCRMQRYYDERQGALGRNGLGTRLNDKMGGGGGGGGNVHTGQDGGNTQPRKIFVMLTGQSVCYH